jgi:hypothetical protein
MSCFSCWFIKNCAFINPIKPSKVMIDFIFQIRICDKQKKKNSEKKDNCPFVGFKMLVIFKEELLLCCIFKQKSYFFVVLHKPYSIYLLRTWTGINLKAHIVSLRYLQVDSSEKQIRFIFTYGIKELYQLLLY